MGKIFVGVKDPGGANAIIPIIKGIEDKNQIKVFASGLAKSICITSELDFEDSDNMEVQFFSELFYKEKPDLILTGTSQGSSVEDKMISAAKKVGIRSMAIMDYWGSYGIRFIDDLGQFKYVPDVLCVIDQTMFEEVISEGFISTEALRITGNPFFDKLANESITYNILLALQPNQAISAEALGYTEFDVLSDIIGLLGEVVKENQVFVRLNIRKHPKESIEKYNNYLKEKFSMGLNITVEFDKIQDTWESIRSNDLIIGMRSMLLFEAAILGKKTISYQPNLKYKDTLKSNELGLSQLITEKSQLKEEISKYLSKKVNDYIKTNATKRVIDVIEEETKSTI